VILAGDVGGTKTILGLFARGPSGPTAVTVSRFATPEFQSLEAMLQAFVPAGTRIEGACLGLPGAVVDGSADLINVGWVVERDRVAHSLGLRQAVFLNDLEAMAHGIAALQPRQLMTLNPGRPVATANAALIAAGTGLGEAVLYWNGKERVPTACEAGHADYAPRNGIEMGFLAWLIQERGGPVSWDMVLSGRGLVDAYQYLRAAGPAGERKGVTQQMETEDPAAVIAREGLSGQSPLCVAALELFANMYGAEAGNLALRSLALGGVYVGGGVAAKLAAKLRDGAFLRAFLDKDRMTSLLKDVPVHLILEETTALLGAARVAAARGGA